MCLKITHYKKTKIDYKYLRSNHYYVKLCKKTKQNQKYCTEYELCDKQPACFYNTV